MKKRRIDFPGGGQLFTPIPKLRLYNYIAGEELHTLNGSMMPFMAWPDGTPCLLANAYMISLREKSGRGGNGPSRFGTKGGSFGEYAAQISPLLRFCYYNQLSLLSLSDDDFYQFVDGLRVEKKPGKPFQNKRGERRITTIGRRCLNFLSFVGEFNGMHGYVGVDGIISIVMVDKVYFRNGKPIKRTSVHHRSFRTDDAKKGRRPIGQETVEKLRESIDKISTSEFLCARRHIMLSLFEELGGRRGEIWQLTVAQILAAAKMREPILILVTLKQGGIDRTREMTISLPMIDELLNYVRGERRKLMRRWPGASDHGFLFVAERGGQPLGIDTITTEFSIIRRGAGIEEQACAHLFRHSFCTNIVASLIAETQALSPESFRQTLMTNKMLAEQAMAKSGHATLESLLEYVDSGFKAKSKYEKVLRNVDLARGYEVYERRRRSLVAAFKADKISKEEYIKREESLAERWESMSGDYDQ